jgi:hypothetical protein
MAARPPASTLKHQTQRHLSRSHLFSPPWVQRSSSTRRPIQTGTHLERDGRYCRRFALKIQPHQPGTSIPSSDYPNPCQAVDQPVPPKNRICCKLRQTREIRWDVSISSKHFDGVSAHLQVAQTRYLWPYRRYRGERKMPRVTKRTADRSNYNLGPHSPTHGLQSRSGSRFVTHCPHKTMYVKVRNKVLRSYRAVSKKG